MAHYVYMLSVPDTGFFYIGRTSSFVSRSQQHYLAIRNLIWEMNSISSAYNRTKRKGGVKLIKQVLGKQEVYSIIARQIRKFVPNGRPAASIRSFYKIEILQSFKFPGDAKDFEDAIIKEHGANKNCLNRTLKIKT